MAEQKKAAGAQPDKAQETKRNKKDQVEAQAEKIEGDLQSRILETESRAAAVEDKLEQKEKKVGELEDRLLRTVAEYDNHRKRSQKETEQAFNNGLCHAVYELLPIVDTLETAANCECHDEEYKKGVLLTLSKCEEVFKKMGVEPIEAMGQPFDPELHNAVMQQPAEGAESGTVTQEVQKGYKLGDKIIRHSMVGVAP